MYETCRGVSTHPGFIWQVTESLIFLCSDKIQSEIPLCPQSRVFLNLTPPQKSTSFPNQGFSGRYPQNGIVSGLSFFKSVFFPN